MFRFIHAADIHIDSPLRGLDAVDDAPTERLRRATRQAFVNLIDWALEEEAGFVVIAGDLFDGKWPDMRTGLWTASQFRRLQAAGIPVYLIRGNHDAASKVRQAVTWPDNVHEFSVRAPETKTIKPLGVALHGQGFKDQACEQDLAQNYPKATPGMFNIGVLHTSLSGYEGHDTYAPTTIEALQRLGYDYWALGHIHNPPATPLSEQPFVAYSGNTQGRHIREPGEKGCLLLTVDDGELVSVESRPTDVVRWHLAEVQLRETDAIADLLARVQDELEACHRLSEGRASAVRVVIRGRCAAHHSLVCRVEREETLAEIRNRASAIDDELWVEKVLLETAPPVDLEQLRAASDLMGDLLSTIDFLRSDDDELLELSRELSPLIDKAGVMLVEAGVDLEDTDRLRAWLAQAEGLLVSQLLEANE